jgi:hypothetical protein
VILKSGTQQIRIYDYNWKTTMAMAVSFGNKLAKLTSNNFDAIATEVLEFAIDNCHVAVKCVKNILGQATSNPKQCELYAKFADRICAGNKILKKMLVIDFCKLAKLRLAINVSNPNIEAEFRLTVELFKVGLLPVEVLNDYVNRMMISNLEFLCKQLTVNGQHIELINASALNAYFVKLNAIALKKETNGQKKLAIENLIVLRRNNWSA